MEGRAAGETNSRYSIKSVTFSYNYFGFFTYEKNIPTGFFKSIRYRKSGIDVTAGG